MDARLKYWIIKKNDEGSRPSAINSFLLILKNDPERILDVFAKNIHGWAISCMTELKIDLDFSNSRAECQYLLEEMKKHYAKQLAEMDEPKKSMDASFKAWIVGQYDLFTKFEMDIFLRMLKKDPEKIVINISEFARKHFMELGIIIPFNDSFAEREEILQALQEHFATQLAEIA